MRSRPGRVRPPWRAACASWRARLGGASLIVLALAIVPAACAPAASRSGPRLAVSPSAGVGKARVVVSGRGFRAGARGSVSAGRHRLARVRADRRGRFRVRVRIPAGRPGRLVLTATLSRRVRVRITRRGRGHRTRRTTRVVRRVQRARAAFRRRAPRRVAPPTPPAVPGGTATIAAVGDINPPGTVGGNPGATAQLAASMHPQVILGLGDFQYQYGSLSALNAGFDKNWGSLKSLIRPTPGPTHDVTGGASDQTDYGAYWGRDPYQPYSFDVGAWHIISLPSAAYRYGKNTAGILAWLRSDLAADRAQCTLAYWHEPYWTRKTAEHDRDMQVKPWVDALYAAGADVILSGHQHDYQRFAPQNPSDQRDDARGLREFVVGTGGIGYYPFTGTAANLDASNASTYGVLQMTLHPTSYSWSFVPTKAGGFTDSGSADCH